MANIGLVKADAKGTLLGWISTLSFDREIGLRPVNRVSEAAPHFDIMAKNDSGRWIPVGAFWERASKENGLIYLSGKVDAPELRAPLYIAAFRQDDGSFAIAWSRTDTSASGMSGRAARQDQPEQSGGDAFGGAPGYGGGPDYGPGPDYEAPAEADDGLGESTAPSARGRRGRGASQPSESELTTAVD